MVGRYGTTKVVVVGLCISAFVLVCYGIESIMASTLWGFLVRFLFGVGLAFTATPATESIMSSLPRNRAGVGSAVNDTTRQIGGALGVAVIGSVFAARYRSALGDLSSFPAAAAEAAQNSIGRATSAAAGLPVDQAAQLLSDSRHAYLLGMRLGVWLCAGLLLVTAVLAAKFLPSTAATPDDDVDRRVAEIELASLDDGIL